MAENRRRLTEDDLLGIIGDNTLTDSDLNKILSLNVHEGNYAPGAPSDRKELLKRLSEDGLISKGLTLVKYGEDPSHLETTWTRIKE